jgi:hypothetical protein
VNCANWLPALDRWIPQVERAGEASIARDAAARKVKALKRIAELEAHDSLSRSTSAPAQNERRQDEPRRGRMAIAWSSSSMPAGYHSTLVVDPDAISTDAGPPGRREGSYMNAVKHKFTIVALLADAITTAATIGCGLFSS